MLVFLMFFFFFLLSNSHRNNSAQTPTNRMKTFRCSICTIVWNYLHSNATSPILSPSTKTIHCLRPTMNAWSNVLCSEYFVSSVGTYLLGEIFTSSITIRCRYFQRMLVFAKMSHEVLRAFILEFLQIVDRERVIVLFSGWTMPTFPVDGNVLMRKGIKGAQLGSVLKELKDKWVDNDFVLLDDSITDVITRFKSANKTWLVTILCKFLA